MTHESTMPRHSVASRAPSDVLDALQLLLLVQFVVAELYSRGVSSPALIPSTDLSVFTTMSTNENAHVTTLKGLIVGHGAAPVVKPAFDFTAKGNAPNFDFGATEYATFTVMAQALSDLAVRAFKGQLAQLITDRHDLVTVMEMHSVQARHAAEIRRVRSKKSWITGNSRDDLPAFAQPIYDGEDIVTQVGVDLTAIASSVGGAASASEAFDEPLDKSQVSAIIALFVA